jgi:hypothetical protein
MMKAISFFMLFVTLCISLFFDRVNAQVNKPLADYKYEYAVKIVCGEQKDSKNLMLAGGLYATTINIHNPNDSAAIFYKKLALTYPPSEERAGKIIALGLDTLFYDQALKTDGNDIRKHYNFSSYIEGFVIIQSTRSLDVSAVYSSATKSGFLRRSYKVVSMDVENIPEREIKRCHPPDTVTTQLDHFLIYRVDTIGFKVEMTLETMFDPEPKKAEVAALEYFANPAKKWHDNSLTDISYPDGHFTIYGFDWWQEPRRRVEFDNQFGSYGVVLGDTTLLMVPAQKMSHAFPDNLDHYKCYQVEGIFKQPESTIIKVDDQFNMPQEVIVKSPVYVGVPVKKILRDGSTYAPVNKDNFLVIYDIEDQSIKTGIKIKDQFMDEGLNVIKRVMLAVPGTKLRWEQ